MESLAIDASAARSGGGVNRVRELASTLDVLTPHLRCLFAVSPTVSNVVPRFPSKASIALLPGWASTVPTRMAWEHLLLPRIIGRSGFDWVLSPFNVLPLGRYRGERPKQAVIISNIGPFERRLFAEVRGYQVTRLKLLRSLTIRSLRMADVVFLLSEEAGKCLDPYLSRATVVLLPMSPPHPDLIESASAVVHPPSAPSRPYFVTVGDLMKHKGIEDAVTAVAELERRGINIQLVVCGRVIQRDYAKKLDRMAASTNCVSFVGPLPQAEVLALMRHATATIISSRVENRSRVPIEAMSVGSPLICADVASSRSSAGKASLYYPPGDHRSLADLMWNLHHDEATRASLIASGKARINNVDWMSASRTILTTLGMS